MFIDTVTKLHFGMRGIREREIEGERVRETERMEEGRREREREREEDDGGRRRGRSRRRSSPLYPLLEFTALGRVFYPH